MTTRVWSGGSAAWTDPAAWVGGVAPLLDDTAVVDAGTLDFVSRETVDAATIDVQAAALVLQDSLLGFGTTINATSGSAPVLLQGVGASGFGGDINATASGGSFTIDSAAGSLTLLESAVVALSGGDTMVLDGTLDSHATVNVGNGGDFVNDGTIAQISAAFEVEVGGTLGGSGVFRIGLYSSLNFQAGSAASGEAVRFTDVGGRLLLDNPANFSGTVSNFATGDLCDLTSIVANFATYDPATGLLMVKENGAVVATLTLDAPAGDNFFTTPDGDTGSLVELQGTQTRLNYTIDAADRALGGDTVRTTMTTERGTPITGAGVRVGIISDSFDEPLAGIAADPSNMAAAAGYLPQSGGASAVAVLSEGNPGDSDEGLALAELVHQVAPDASLDFASADGGLGGFANAVNDLQLAGCRSSMISATTTSRSSRMPARSTPPSRAPSPAA